MLKILKKIQNSFNDKSLNTNNIIKKSIKTCNSKINEYNYIIFNPYSSKEWFSSVYSYNKLYIKSLISYDAVLNKLFRSYCTITSKLDKFILYLRGTLVILIILYFIPLCLG